jgi:hypothetical protein
VVSSSGSLLLAAVIGGAATICGDGDGNFSFPSFSFLSCHFNKLFAFFLFFSASRISWLGFEQHSSRYSSGTSGQYSFQSSTCLISLSPIHLGYSFVGSSRSKAFCASPTIPLFCILSLNLESLGILNVAVLEKHIGNSKLSRALEHLPL